MIRAYRFMDAMLLVDALRNPPSTRGLDANSWTALIAMARAEQLIGTLAHRLQTEALPTKVAEILDDARSNAEHQKRSALWEADCAARALADYGGTIVLLKGTAYVAAGLKAGEGRHIGDLDILVAREDLPQVESALLEKGGWEWVKEDAYDDAYYRDHMHELPPLIHKDRDRMIDVHHTILPLTAGPTPDAVGLLGAAISASQNPFVSSPSTARRAGAQDKLQLMAEVETPGCSAPTERPLDDARGERNLGLQILCPTDMVIHCATHLIADGDLAGGLRNLWDMHCLTTEFAESDEDFWSNLKARAAHHQLWPAVHRAARLAHELYGTAIPKDWQDWNRQDKWFIHRLAARDGWGRPTRKFTRQIFYIRSHLLRMPPLMLARHLFTKWRKVK